MVFQQRIFQNLESNFQCPKVQASAYFFKTEFHGIQQAIDVTFTVAVSDDQPFVITLGISFQNNHQSCGHGITSTRGRPYHACPLRSTKLLTVHSLITLVNQLRTGLSMGFDESNARLQFGLNKFQVSSESNKIYIYI